MSLLHHGVATPKFYLYKSLVAKILCKCHYEFFSLHYRFNILYFYVLYLQVGGVVDRPSTPPSWAGSQMSLNSQQTGIRNLQKSIDETSKIKQEVS